MDIVTVNQILTDGKQEVTVATAETLRLEHQAQAMRQEMSELMDQLSHQQKSEQSLTRIKSQLQLQMSNLNSAIAAADRDVEAVRQEKLAVMKETDDLRQQMRQKTDESGLRLQQLSDTIRDIGMRVLQFDADSDVGRDSSDLQPQ